MDSDGFLFKLKTILAYLDLSNRIKDVQGYLLDIHAYTLLTLANEGPGTGVIVEIGSFMGKSTCCLALGTKSAYREVVYAVDHFKGSPEHQQGEACEVQELVETGTTYDRFEENIRRAGVADYVRAIPAASAEASAGWNKPIRLLFIDGDHSYEASKVDFECWAPHVVVGGIVAFHDIGGEAGVTDFYKDLLASTEAYREVIVISGLAILEKVARG